MSNPRTTLCLSGPLKSFTATPREVACHVTTHARSLSLLLRGDGPLEAVLKNTMPKSHCGRTGVTLGLCNRSL